MFRKISNKILLALFLLLLTLFVVMQVLDSRKGERTFKSELAAVDTSKVFSVIIYPKSDKKNDIKLIRGADSWSVENKGKRFNADEEVVKNVLAEFTALFPERVAATDTSKWAEFEVNDSLGTRVKALSDKETLADIMVGKFSFNQQNRKVTTYVRLNGEDITYAVDGFLNMTFNREVNAFRNKNIIPSNPAGWTKLVFSYPADSSFTLILQGEKWLAGGLLADSAKTAQYISSLSTLAGSDFLENATLNIAPSHTLKIEGANLTAPVVLKAFPADTVNQYIITSSINLGAAFSGSKAGLFNKIFPGKLQFVNSDTRENL